MTTAFDKPVAQEPAAAGPSDAGRTGLRILGRPGRAQRYEPALIGVGSVVVFLIVWQAVAWWRIQTRNSNTRRHARKRVRC